LCDGGGKRTDRLPVHRVLDLGAVEDDFEDGALPSHN
jgi:hypothetical protein